MENATVFEHKECFDADFYQSGTQAIKLEQIPNAQLHASPQFNNPINDKKTNKENSII